MDIGVKTGVGVGGCVCMDGGLWRQRLGIVLGKDQFSDCEGRDGEHWPAPVYLHIVSSL